MKIVVAVRCYNESKNIARFMRGYDFADVVVVSDGGSEDDSVSILKQYPKVQLHHFREYEIVDGHRWNVDAPHMNFVLNKAKELKPDWLIFDDMDCAPNIHLRMNWRWVFEERALVWQQINVFRLYLWGDNQYFPYMNRNFDPNYTSLWAWRPDRLDIHADESVRHGTLVGLSKEPLRLDVPYVLLHKSYSPETIDAKLKRYNTLGLPMLHPLETNGELASLPEWAVE